MALRVGTSGRFQWPWPHWVYARLLRQSFRQAERPGSTLCWLCAVSECIHAKSELTVYSVAPVLHHSAKRPDDESSGTDQAGDATRERANCIRQGSAAVWR